MQVVRRHRNFVVSKRGLFGLFVAILWLACAPSALATTWTVGTPLDATSPPNLMFGGVTGTIATYVSCPTAGNCTAITNMEDNNDYYDVVAYNESGGVWQQPTVLNLPTANYPHVIGISCTSPGDCLAIGDYQTVDNSTQTTQSVWQISESGGSWGSASTIGLPGTAQANTSANAPTGIACSTGGDCVAVGWFTDSSNTQYPMIASGGVGGVSSFTQTSADGDYSGVGCSDGTTTCILVGTDAGGGFVQTDAGGSLSSTQDIATVDGDHTALSSVACPTLNQCVVAGQNYPGERFGAAEPFVVSQSSSGVWGSETSLSANGSGYPMPIGQIACLSVGNCLLGSDGSGNEFYVDALLARETDGSWSGFSPPPLPSDAETGETALSDAEGVGCAGSRCDLLNWETDSSPNGDVYGVWTLSESVNLAASGTGLLCSPDPEGTTTYDCTATVSDASGAGTPTTPTGSVTLSADAGTFSNSGSCQLVATASAGQASCALTYTPASQNDSSVTITANYGGDQNFAPSQGQTSVSAADALTIHAAVVNEPASGSVQVAVTVTLSSASASASTVTVDYATEDGTATTAHGDYTTTSGTLTFTAGQTTATFYVTVNASGLTQDSGFGVVLSNPVGATISVGEATVQITDQALITGLVKDRQGHALPGVTVQFVGSSGTKTTVTSSSGQYSEELGQGSYTVTALPGDGRYVPQAGAGCTVSGASCQVTIAAQGSQTANFEAALNVDSVTFAQENLSTGAVDAVPDSGTYDGNTVQVKATISNAGSVPLSTQVSFGRAASTSADSATPLVSAGDDQGSVTVPAGGTASVTFDWNTQGDAWTDSGEPDSDHIIRATLALTPAYGQQSITVLPKPVILVHGLASDASTWAAYPGFMKSVNPDWQAFAVGDGQAPGVMNTTPIDTPSAGRGNTILQNAQQEAEYIQGIRDQTGAWHVDIVAHSMGGLISRQYIDSLMPADPPDGGPVVSHLVMLGTPNEGSPCADSAVMAEGFAASFPMMQLTPEFMLAFNQVITDRHGVVFSIAAGRALANTCLVPIPGDSVVTVGSALWDISDSEVVAGVLHTEMTGDQMLFDSWVVPHLAIGPDAGGASAQLAHDGHSTATAHRPQRKVRVCRAATGLSPAVSAAGELTATPSGGTQTITVRAARAMSLSVLAPSMGLTLESPSGHVVKRIALNSAVALGNLFDTIEVKHPQVGRWQLTVRTTSGHSPAAYTLAEQGLSVRLTAKVTIRKRRLRVVTARFLHGGRGVQRARVRVRLVLPDGERRTLALERAHGEPGEYQRRADFKLGASSNPLEAIVSATAPGATITTVLTRASACVSRQKG